MQANTPTHSNTYGVSFFEEVDFPRSAIDSKGLGGACQLAYAAVLAGSISMSHDLINPHKASSKELFN